MRPLRLEFQAFGSYPGRHVVDFEALGRRGLFVVTGPTGSGKTMVFDAMVYGLYGRLPGGRASEGEVRSHHAANDVETYVQLDFEVDGTRYRVRRTPKWERPKQRSSGTTVQPPTAIVGTLIGDDIQPIATHIHKVTGECEHLVGLDSTQFQRVVLLPQGKFSDFLIANDETREVLLRQLFGGELYERATKLLKQRADDLDAQVRDVDVDVQHHRANAVDQLAVVLGRWTDEVVTAADLAERTDQQLAAALDALEPRRDQHQAAMADAQRAATAATEARAQAEAAAARHRDARLQQATLQRLADDEATVAADEAAVAASRRARPVVVAQRLLDAAVAEAEGAAIAEVEWCTAVRAAFEALDRPVPQVDPGAVAAAVAAATAEVDASLDQVATRARVLGELQRAEARAAVLQQSLDEAEVEAHALHGRATELQRRLSELQPIADDRVKRQVARSDATKRVAARRGHDDAMAAAAAADATADDAKAEYESLMARFVATQAPRLAAQLTDGEPCAVCGSVEHPHPARLDGSEPVDHDTVDRARGAWSAAQNKAASHRTRAAAHLESLGAAATLSLDELEAAAAEAADALVQAQLAEQEVQEVAAASSEVQSRAAAVTGRTVELGKQLAAALATLHALQLDHDRLVELTAGLHADRLEADADVLRRLTTVAATGSAVFEAATRTSTARRTAEAAVAVALHAGGFVSVADAHAALLPEADEDARARRVDDWKHLLATTTARLEQLLQQGVPDVEPDVDALAHAAAAAEAVAQAATSAFVTVANLLDAARAALQRAAAVAAGSAELRKERDTARIVYRTCNGEAGQKVKLERWVLGIELDRVTHAANGHLAAMTGHRYRLQRALGQRGGLGLEVFDAHTGRARPTPTLSGGEQFQASLALALGLADVVSHGGVASGKQFEAMFVDEGFGTLDPDALDDAIAALTMLQAAGRMVGVITHVDTLQQQLHVGIEVQRLQGGRGSTLVVHP